jgi:hypothetical protein
MSKTTRMIRTIVPTPMYMAFPLVAVNAGAQIRPANRPSHCPQSARPNQPARPWLAMTRSEMKGPHDSHQGRSSSYSLFPLCLTLLASQCPAGAGLTTERPARSAAAVILRSIPPNTTPWNGDMDRQYTCPASPRGWKIAR